MPTRDRRLLVAALLLFALWLASIGPVRTWASHVGLRGHWAVGVAPSFLAGFTFVLWQAFATRSRPLVCAAYAVALVVLTELAQLVLPGYTADVWDVVAGAVGAGLAVPVLLRLTRQAIGFSSR